MSYATIAARVQTLLQAMSDFDDADVTLGDRLVLEMGSPPYAVICDGGFEEHEGYGYGGYIVVWSVIVELYTEYLEEVTSRAAHATTRQNVLDELNKYPTLNKLTNVKRAIVASGSRPEAKYDTAGGGPYLIKSELELAVTERVDSSGGEWV